MPNVPTGTNIESSQEIRPNPEQQRQAFEVLKEIFKDENNESPFDGMAGFVMPHEQHIITDDGQIHPATIVETQNKDGETYPRLIVFFQME